MDPFLLLLTPILLLAIVALFAFVGCSFSPVAFLYNIATGAANTSSITLPLTFASGGELLVVTIQWAGAGKPVFTPPILQAIPPGDALHWNGMQILTYSGTNPQHNANIVVELQDNVGQPVNSPVQWNAMFAAYSSSDSSPFFGAVSTNPALTGPIISAAPVGVDSGQAIYGCAFAADGGVVTGAFPGNNTLTVTPLGGRGFTTGAGNPVLFARDFDGAESFTAQATNSNTGPNQKGFMFVVGIKGSVAEART